MTRTHSKYDGDASISRSGKKFRVWIEAPNVTAETYISERRARELYETLDWIFRVAGKRRATEDRGEGRGR